MIEKKTQSKIVVAKMPEHPKECPFCIDGDRCILFDEEDYNTDCVYWEDDQIDRNCPFLISLNEVLKNNK